MRRLVRTPSIYVFGLVAVVCVLTAAATFGQTLIPQAGWSLAYVDSQDTTGGNYAATNAFDGNTGSFWHTQWYTAQPPCPHEIQINLGGMYNVSGFRYLPRQDGVPNGRISQYEFYVSVDGINWGSPVASGTLTNTASQQEIDFTAKPGQYIRLRALSEVAGRPYTCAAEINVLSTGDRPPDGTIQSPATDVSIAPGGTVNFSGSATDPENDTPFTYHWNFGDPAMPDSNAQNPGIIQFNNPGYYTVTMTVTDSQGNPDPSPATRTVIVQASNIIPHTNWALLYVDSQDPTGGSTYVATNSFDNNINTFWHTQWATAQPPPPHDIQINMGAVYNVSGFHYLPRQDGSPNGRIGQYEFYVSTDGIHWGTKVASGTLANTASEQEILFSPKAGQYIWLRALSEVGGRPYTSMAELNVLSSGNLPPDSTINSPAADVTIAPGGSINFAGSGTDPENNTPFTYHWTFGDPAIPDSTLANPGVIQFNNPGTFTVTFTVTDSQGNPDPVPATRTITVQTSTTSLIPRNNWTLQFVDSQDMTGNYAATNSFDGNASTFWHTQWATAQPPCPHEIQINLGAMYNVSGFHYLPRQDGNTGGRIGQYEFYVSTDGVYWGDPVATGTFANDASEKEVLFGPKAGHYIRLRALTEVSGQPYTSMAELNVLNSGTPDGVITSPKAAEITIPAGGTLNFVGTGSDLAGHTPLTYHWTFGAGSGVADSTSAAPGVVQFNNPGTYTVSFTVTDSLGLDDPTPATRVVRVLSNAGTLVSQAGWTLLYVDSQDLSGGNYAATNAFDGKTNTFWHTQWYTAQPPPPHDIQINLGSTHNISGFHYLPRQDGVPNGRIANYEFYVSQNGINWGSPVATGTLANTASEQEVVFTPKSGQYIWLRALTEVAGRPYTSAAEINVLEAGSADQPPDGSITSLPGDITISLGDTVNFTGSGTDPDGNPLSFLWNFGTGSGINDAYLQNPGAFQFNVAGTYTITYTVTDSLGLADPTRATRTITVMPGNRPPSGTIYTPQSDLTIHTGDSVTFKGNAADPDNNTPLTYSWNFGTGSGIANSNALNPSPVTFNNPGNFIVTFTVTDSQGKADPTPAQRTITVLGNNNNIISRTNPSWSLRFVDSQDTTGGNFAAINCFDGDKTTMWHTQWKTAQPPPPHEIQINLGAVHNISGFRDLPRQDVTLNGRIGQYEFYVSSDGINWGNPVATGIFPNTKQEREVLFPPVSGQYIRLRALTEINGLPFTSVAELNVLQADAAVNQYPNVTMDSPSSNISVLAGSAVNFASTANDPDGNLPLSYRWSFSPGSGVTDNLNANPGLIHFNNPGSFVATLTVSDSLGHATAVTRNITVLGGGTLASKAGWSVKYVDSQDNAGQNFAANAFDGNSLTFWHTEFSSSKAPPHEIQIDLGATHEVGGFRYLPTQDGNQAGRIGQYRFYVSGDGVHWGVPVASGNFTNTPLETEVDFAPKPGRYVRLQATSEISGGPYTAVAELGILDAPVVTPTVRLVQPKTDYLQTSGNLYVLADASLSAGQGVRLVIDGGPGNGGAQVDVYSAPYDTTFAGLDMAPHTVDAYVIDGGGAIVSSVSTHDQATQIGIGTYYVAMGDSITSGFGDDIPTDDSSLDGRTTGGGYTPILDDSLTAALSRTNVVINEGLPGAYSRDGATVVPILLQRYPNADRFLIMYGTNDAGAPIPTGLGLHPGDSGYAGSYKDNMQRIVNDIKSAGKLPILAKAPVVPPVNGSGDQLIQQYNAVIDELNADPTNNISIIGPDFHAGLQTLTPSDYFDALHPNGIGYQLMGRLWFNVLAP